MVAVTPGTSWSALRTESIWSDLSQKRRVERVLDPRERAGGFDPSRDDRVLVDGNDRRLRLALDGCPAQLSEPEILSGLHQQVGDGPGHCGEALRIGLADRVEYRPAPVARDRAPDLRETREERQVSHRSTRPAPPRHPRWRARATVAAGRWPRRARSSRCHRRGRRGTRRSATATAP